MFSCQAPGLRRQYHVAKRVQTHGKCRRARLAGHWRHPTGDQLAKLPARKSSTAAAAKHPASVTREMRRGSAALLIHNPNISGTHHCQLAEASVCPVVETVRAATIQPEDAGLSRPAYSDTTIKRFLSCRRRRFSRAPITQKGYMLIG